MKYLPPLLKIKMKTMKEFIKEYDEINHQLNQSLNDNWERVIPKDMVTFDIPFLFYKHKSKDIVLYYDLGLVWKPKGKYGEEGYWVKSKSKYNQPSFVLYKNNRFDYYGDWYINQSDFMSSYKTFNGVINFCNKI